MTTGATKTVAQRPSISARVLDSMDEQGFRPAGQGTKVKTTQPVAVGALAAYNAKRLGELERTGHGNSPTATGLRQEIKRSQELGPRMKRAGMIPKDADVDEFFAGL